MTNAEREATKRASKKKAAQLGLPIGTASSRLRKLVLFRLLQDAGRDVCYQCGERIESVEQLSIEHKDPWLDSDDPVGRFFDLDNIAFSHQKCNSIGGPCVLNPTQHGTMEMYRRGGCRCEECRAWKARNNKKYR